MIKQTQSKQTEVIRSRNSDWALRQKRADTLVKTIERLLTNGNSWIPELIVIALLSEWIIEEEKSTYFYPFLKIFSLKWYFFFMLQIWTNLLSHLPYCLLFSNIAN